MMPPVDNFFYFDSELLGGTTETTCVRLKPKCMVDEEFNYFYSLESIGTDWPNIVSHRLTWETPDLGVNHLQRTKVVTKLEIYSVFRPLQLFTLNANHRSTMIQHKVMTHIENTKLCSSAREKSRTNIEPHTKGKGDHPSTERKYNLLCIRSARATTESQT